MRRSDIAIQPWVQNRTTKKPCWLAERFLLNRNDRRLEPYTSCRIDHFDVGWPPLVALVRLAVNAMDRGGESKMERAAGYGSSTFSCSLFPG